MLILVTGLLSQRYLCSRRLLTLKKVKVAHTRLPKRRVPELMPVLGSQPAGDTSHKPGGRLPLLSARPAVTPATLKRAATNFAVWWTEAQWVWAVSLRHPTAAWLRFEPGPFCAWVQHANHSATEPPSTNTKKVKFSHTRTNTTTDNTAQSSSMPCNTVLVQIRVHQCFTRTKVK